MGQTAKYCDECERKLSPADKSPKDKAFFKASLFQEGSHPVYTRLQTEEGVCEKCGKMGVVIFYEDRD